MGIFDKIKKHFSKKGAEKDIKIPKKQADIEKKYKIELKSSPGKRYSVMGEYKSCGLRKLSPKNADDVARVYMENATKTMSANKIMPGQLISFNYFTPKTADQLEYYDAKPVTIFFCVFNAKDGKRILGFNIHYYPPKIRAKVMDRIYKMFESVYGKYFDTNIPAEVSGIEYQALVQSLKKAKLDFGVREYIPSLCHQVRQVPPNMWNVALYTEGVFKKRTREQILKFWKQRKG